MPFFIPIANMYLWWWQWRAQASHRNQMKFVNAITTASIISSPFIAYVPVEANQFRYCEPATRCMEYSVCFINQVKQPCAYGSGGAAYGGIIFDHGYFFVEWLSDGGPR